MALAGNSGDRRATPKVKKKKKIDIQNLLNNYENTNLKYKGYHSF